MLSQTKQLLIVLVVLNIVAVMFYSSLFVWLRRTTLETTELAEDLRRQTEREVRLRSVGQLVTDTASERAIISGYFVTEDQIVDIITLLELLGEDAQVDELEILSVTKNPDITSNASSLSLKVQVSGSWRALYYLLSLIEIVPRTVFVDAVSLSYQPPTGENESQTAAFWRGTITVNTVLAPGDTAVESG